MCSSDLVKLSICKINDREIKVIVEDDGKGISSDIVDKIYNNNMGDNKIGMSNVHNRLKHLYGEGLLIEHLERGTKIRFNIRSLEG